MPEPTISPYSNPPRPLSPEQETDALLYAVNISATLAGLYFAPRTTGAVLYGATGLGIGPSGRFAVSPIVVAYALFPPPFGFAPPSLFGLEPNYMRTALERMGVPPEKIPPSDLLSTQHETPEIQAERERLSRHVVQSNYARLIGRQSTEQLRADVSLYSAAQQGLLGPVPGNLPVRELNILAGEELRRRGVPPGEIASLEQHPELRALVKPTPQPAAPLSPREGIERVFAEYARIGARATVGRSLLPPHTGAVVSAEAGASAEPVPASGGARVLVPRAPASPIDATTQPPASSLLASVAAAAKPPMKFLVDARRDP